MFSKNLISEKVVNTLFTHYRNLIVLITLSMASIWGWQQLGGTMLPTRIALTVSLIAFNIYCLYLWAALEFALASKVQKTREPYAKDSEMMPRMIWQAHILSYGIIVWFIVAVTFKK